MPENPKKQQKPRKTKKNQEKVIIRIKKYLRRKNIKYSYTNKKLQGVEGK